MPVQAPVEDAKSCGSQEVYSVQETVAKADQTANLAS